MIIDNSGNVGIGTTTPQVALDVYGNAHLNGGLVVTGSTVNVNGVNVVVATGSNQALIPQQGDLSMGTFTDGPQPQ